MDPLAGWTIAVTADRGASEQAELLQRRGAEVVLAPLVHTVSVGEDLVADATRRVLAAPVDHVVIASGTGLRLWVAMAWSSGHGDAVLDLLSTARVWARGVKAVGALVGEGIDSARREDGQTLAEIASRLVAEGVAGKRIAVQCHGGDHRSFVAELASAGADVVDIPVYRVEAAPGAGAERLASICAEAQLDAVTFTSTAAIEALAADEGLLASLRRADVACACVGPETATTARSAALPGVVVPSTPRTGSMLRALGEAMATKGTTFSAGGVRVRHQGQRVQVDDAVVRLTPRERRLLEAMLATPGAVLSKERLAATAWDDPVDGHTVEVTVNRLRRKLGPAAGAVETTNRRGYRIAV